jgi:tellurite resistance protein
MAALYTRLSTTTASLTVDYLANREEDVLQALGTTGALVALADGQLETVERDELVNFVDRQGFVPTISQRQIAEAFDDRVRQIVDQDSANVTVEALRPLAGLSLASVVVRTAERVAAADRKIHPGELRALKLIRLIMMTLPVERRPTAVVRTQHTIAHWPA